MHVNRRRGPAHLHQLTMSCMGHINQNATFCFMPHPQQPVLWRCTQPSRTHSRLVSCCPMPFGRCCWTAAAVKDHSAYVSAKPHCLFLLAMELSFSSRTQSTARHAIVLGPQLLVICCTLWQPIVNGLADREALCGRVLRLSFLLIMKQAMDATVSALPLCHVCRSTR